MDKLLNNHLGGLSIEQDDLEFMETAIRRAITGMNSPYSTQDNVNYLLSGCAVTEVGLNYSVAPGFVVLYGEVLEVLAHTVPKNALHTFYWNLTTEYDSDGDEDDFNGAAVQTYQLRRARLESSENPPNNALELNTETFKTWSIMDSLAEQVGSKIGVWTEIPLVDLSVVQNDASGGLGNDVNLVQNPDGGFFKYCRIGNLVHINFKLQNLITTVYNGGSSASSIKIKSLPFNFNGVQEGVYFAICNSQAAALDGANPAFTLDDSNQIVFNIVSPDNGSRAAFNANYQFNDLPAMSTSSMLDGVTQFRWTLSGSLTFECKDI